jgi:hypothetical protein
MPTHEHQSYRTNLILWFMKHGREPGVAEEVEMLAPAILVLWNLDLEPARPILAACYASSPRGSKPWDPIVLVRCLLLALLMGQTKINKWVPQSRASKLLPLLAGIDTNERRPPGVGTYYDLFHRLHDGPVRRTCEHQQRPSEHERRRSESPRPREEKPDKTLDDDTRWNVTERLVNELAVTEGQGNPNDLQDRLGAILLAVGVIPSAHRGLLDLDHLIVGGDGSPLRTGCSGQGKKLCDCEGRHCDCPRVFSDPDARWGWDSYRKCYFFGHHFYELSTSVGDHDLPLAIRIDPGNETDFTASLRCLEWLRKATRSRDLPWNIDAAILDAGHDARPIYQWLLDHGMIPIIPLSKNAPAHHPFRVDLGLSKRGVPMCEGDVEMAPWGSAGKSRKVFICPVKAGWIACCPLAPDDDPQWVCRPDLKVGPSVSVAIDDNPRLFPPVPRNTNRYAELMKLRSGTERSNSVKKEAFDLEGARHRRSSFWLIRLHLIAVLQHARAWLADEDGPELLGCLLDGREVVVEG